jgi:hypothetical protein
MVCSEQLSNLHLQLQYVRSNELLSGSWLLLRNVRRGRSYDDRLIACARARCGPPPQRKAVGNDDGREDDQHVPDDFRRLFTSLVTAIQPRPLAPDTLAVYWAVLRDLPMEALTESADALKRSRFFPNSGDWFQVAHAIATKFQLPIEGSRTLDELDDLAPNDRERDEIAKRLSVADQTALMARYGCHKVEEARGIFWRLASPPAVDASDPQVAHSGTPPTRAKRSSRRPVSHVR